MPLFRANAVLDELIAGFFHPVRLVIGLLALAAH
jgi:hypothetical protein